VRWTAKVRGGLHQITEAAEKYSQSFGTFCAISALRNIATFVSVAVVAARRFGYVSCGGLGPWSSDRLARRRIQGDAVGRC
jgi:hypothetical protein